MLRYCGLTLVRGLLGLQRIIRTPLRAAAIVGRTALLLATLALLTLLSRVLAALLVLLALLILAPLLVFLILWILPAGLVLPLVGLIAHEDSSIDEKVAAWCMRLSSCCTRRHACCIGRTTQSVSVRTYETMTDRLAPRDAPVSAGRTR